MKTRIISAILSLFLVFGSATAFVSCDMGKIDPENETESFRDDDVGVTETILGTESENANESKPADKNESETKNKDESKPTENVESEPNDADDAESTNVTESESEPVGESKTETTVESETQKKPSSSSEASEGLEFVQIGNAYAVAGIGTCNDRSIVIPKEYNNLPVTEICDYAFTDDVYITGIKLPSGIVKIGVSAFSGCTQLKTVSLSNRLEVIGDNAFNGCTKLANLTIPSSVVLIGKKAFYNCTNLTTVTYKGSVSKASELFTSSSISTSFLSSITCSDGVFDIAVIIKQAEYNTTTSVMPSNWNEFTYADNNDTQIMSYIGSSFFTYDYKFENDQKYNANGTINKAGIVAGAYTTNYDAATKLEDVTATVDAKWGYTADQKAEGGYAWKITLRDDLKWDDGTPIKAADFVYSMKQMLDPAFMNYRANTYYDTLMIKNSKPYFFQNREGTYESVTVLGYETLQAAIDAGVTLYVDAFETWAAEGYTDEAGNTCPKWLAINDETVYSAADGSDYCSGLGLWETLMDYGYGPYLEPGTDYASWVTVYVENTECDVKWENVGIYSIDSENAIVICLDKTYEFLTDDGELSVWAPYYMSGLPLVKESLYESCKIAPANGATLWTSNYNSSLATTASWGPYKLVQFDSSYYRLEKNENWYGWNMEEYKNQYNVTAINCRANVNTWTGFFNGTYDDASLPTENVEEYLGSKYIYYTSTSTGTFGMQLYSNLNVLKESENNNGILAIQEFRHAFNLALNRSDVVEKIWPGNAVPCFGLVNVAYYYDIENAPELSDGGQYRNTKQAKEGILRAYGFTQGADGKWSNGTLNNLDLDEAYDSLTGYNPTLAKEKMKAAIEILLADPDKYGYDATKDITLVYGASTDNNKQRFRADYLQGILDYLTSGTALQGRIKVVFDASAGSQWAEAFRTGATQIGFGYGFSGNAFDPFDIIGAFVNPDDSLNYHMYWDTSKIDMTLTMPAGNYAGAGETITMSIQNWYFCLNGLAETERQPVIYNWSKDYAPNEARLTILSALEQRVIEESRSVMLIADGGGSFLSAKFAYFSETEHTFMGFGGIRYMEVVYTDEEWADFVAENNNDLTNVYKQTN